MEKAKEFKTIEYEVLEKGIGLLSLNRPRKFNAVNQEMMEELETFWAERLADLDTHVNADAFYRFQSRLARLNLAMRRAPQPIVAAVHGAAVGLGFSFALASDVRVVTPDVRFAAAYINVGLGGADMACSYFLPRLIGAGRAYEFMLTGNYLSAEESMQLGLVSRLVEQEQLFESAMELARTMNRKNPMGLRLTKEAINMNLDAGGLEQALQMEDRNQTLLALRGMVGGGGTSRYF